LAIGRSPCQFPLGKSVLLIDSKHTAVNYCMMEMDDNLPLRAKNPIADLLKQDLDPLSIDELDERIAALHSEIKRCEAKKQAATNHRSIADELFKKN
jgi:uncharacterized small protein (DUF1192 family)